MDTMEPAQTPAEIRETLEGTQKGGVKNSCLLYTSAMSGIVYAAEKKEIAVSVDCPEDLTVFHDSKWTSEADVYKRQHLGFTMTLSTGRKP